MPDQTSCKTSASAQVREALESLNLRVNKRFGQNFLVDRSVLRDIVSAADITPTDVVIEVGLGLGILTSELARYAGRVIAVEVDRGLAANLESEYRDRPNVTIVNGDILGMTPEMILSRTEQDAVSAGYKVIANLPYYITSPVLRHFLEARMKPRMMVIMVQREVAGSITASPGNMSLLGISVQYFAKPKVVRKVPPGAFYPRPKISSTLLRLDVYEEPPVPVDDTQRFFRTVRAGFSARRKQVHNSLAHGLDLPVTTVADELESAGIDPKRRAETFSISEWAIISKRLSPYVDCPCAGQGKSGA